VSPPPMACAIRLLMAARRRVVACSGGVSSPPRGVVWGWTLVTSCRETPWKPLSASRLLPGGKGEPAHSATALLRRVACIGVAPEAYVPGLVEHAEVVARGTRLLAAVICWWRFGLGRALDRTGRAIMPTQGGWSCRPSPAA
jgi:hypothetical protein